LVEQDIHASSTDTETIYVEVCDIIKKNSDNSSELNQIEEGIIAVNVNEKVYHLILN